MKRGHEFDNNFARCRGDRVAGGVASGQSAYLRRIDAAVGSRVECANAGGSSLMTKAAGPRIAIRYPCHWLLRAAWMAQELLSTFGTDLGEVSLQPGTGGVFVITYDGEVIWERKTDGGFPDVKQLKQRVRDHLDPDRDLGHLDRISGDQGDPAP